MARFVGIDITPSFVRAALVRTTYRSMAVERLLEVERYRVETLEQALQTCALPLIEQGESIAIAVDGEESFIHRLTLPASAQKQLDAVLPFELEAQVPVEFDELVYDYRLLPRDGATTELNVLAAAARTAHVRNRLQLIGTALGLEPQRVGCGPLPLANLANLSAQFAPPEPIALVDIGEARTEMVILVKGNLMAARTVARGMVGLPEGAAALAAELRQTFAAWAATSGEAIAHVWLLGLGAGDPGAAAYLSQALGVPVAAFSGEGISQLAAGSEPMLPRFAKAIALAASLKHPRDLDLRQGPLAAQRSYERLKEKVPLLTGLAGAILISFLFATWAELRSLSREQEVLTTALSALSRDVLGEETADPERAQELLETGGGRAAADPMPHADAFDMLVGISKAIPMSITHDIEEFDLQRGRVKMNGIVLTAADAQKIAGEIKKIRCVQNAKISKITQVIKSDRQKYILDFEVRCPEDQPKGKGKKGKGDAAAKGGEKR